MFLEDRNDPFFGVSLALHLGTFLGQNYREIPQEGWLDLRGDGLMGVQVLLALHSPGVTNLITAAYWIYLLSQYPK